MQFERLTIIDLNVIVNSGFFDVWELGFDSFIWMLKSEKFGQEMGNVVRVFGYNNVIVDQ